MRIKPTTWKRCTVDEIGRVVMEPEPFYRRVTVIVPAEDELEIGLVADAVELDEVIHNLDQMSQDAQWPLMPTDIHIPFEVVPGQAIVSRCRTGQVELSLIIEYLGPA